MTRRGFTLLEVLVASTLLAMLVTILTMIFNQSSIAWTTGTAAVAGLGDARKAIATYQLEADNAILNDASTPVALKVTSIWADDGSGLKTGDEAARTLSTLFEKTAPQPSDMRDPGQSSSGEVPSIAGANSAGRDTYMVGVTSWGPDGQPGTWDDISTMPEEVVK